MELLTIFLSGLLGLVNPAGLLLDRTAEKAIRSELKTAQELQVRVDNVPTHQLLQGRVEKVRIAGRSLLLKNQNIHISLLDLETDPIEFDFHTRKRKQFGLKKPLQMGVRLVLTQQDVNKLLESPDFLNRLKKVNFVSVSSSNNSSSNVYNLANPQIKILENRLRFQLELKQEGNGKPLNIRVESGLNVIAGRQIQLVNPNVVLNQEKAPEKLINQIVNNLNKQLDLGNLESEGVQLRILQLNIKPAAIEIAAFLKIEPSSKFLGKLSS